jgi:putative membrane protein
MNLYLNFASYLGVAVLLMIAGIILFTFSTPKLREFKLIAEKNVSAALLLGGKVIGLAIVLGAAAEYSVSLIDMVIWGAIGILAQIIVFILAEVITIRFSIAKAIEEDNRAVGVMLLSLSLAIGLVIAKCLSY